MYATCAVSSYTADISVCPDVACKRIVRDFQQVDTGCTQREIYLYRICTRVTLAIEVQCIVLGAFGTCRSAASCSSAFVFGPCHTRTCSASGSDSMQMAHGSHGVRRFGPEVGALELGSSNGSHHTRSPRSCDKHTPFIGFTENQKVIEQLGI